MRKMVVIWTATNLVDDHFPRQVANAQIDAVDVDVRRTRQSGRRESIGRAIDCGRARGNRKRALQLHRKRNRDLPKYARITAGQRVNCVDASRCSSPTAATV